MSVSEKAEQLLHTVALQEKLLETYRLYVAVLELEILVKKEVEQNDRESIKG